MTVKAKPKRKTTPKKKAAPRKRPAAPVPEPPEPADDADPKKITFAQKRMLAAYSGCGNITQASLMGKTSRSSHYLAMHKSASYRAAFELAQEEFIDLLRHAAIHRAVKGVGRKKFYQGRPCMVPVLDKDDEPVLDKDGEPVMEQYIETEYSDHLLIHLLRARCPEFVDRQVLEHTGPGGGPIQSQQENQFAQTIDQYSAENLKHLPPAGVPAKPKKPTSRSKRKS